MGSERKHELESVGWGMLHMMGIIAVGGVVGSGVGLAGMELVKHGARPEHVVYGAIALVLALTVATAITLILIGKSRRNRPPASPGGGGTP